MVSMTLSIPEGLKREMDDFQDINWSAVAREAIKKKVAMMQKFREFTEKSELTEKDAASLGKKVNAKAAGRYRT